MRGLLEATRRLQEASTYRLVHVGRSKLLCKRQPIFIHVHRNDFP